MKILSLRACCICFIKNDREILGTVFVFLRLIVRDGIVKWLGLPDESEMVIEH